MYINTIFDFRSLIHPFLNNKCLPCVPVLIYFYLFCTQFCNINPILIKITAQASFDMQTSAGFADFTHFADDANVVSVSVSNKNLKLVYKKCIRNWQ